MTSFLIDSLIASAVLTVLINVMAQLFPGSSAEDRIRELVGEDRESDARPRLRIWFPWKAMLISSVAVSLLINTAELFN